MTAIATIATPAPERVRTLTKAASGTHQQISAATLATAQRIPIPAGGAQIVMQATTANIRYTIDGTDPTPTVGFRLLSNASGPTTIDLPAAATVKVILESGYPVLEYQLRA